MDSVERVIRRTLIGVLTVVVLISTAFAQKKTNEGDQPAPLPGCESKEIKSGKEKGKQERVFHANQAKVKEALLSALAALEFDAKKDEANDIEANKKRHVGVFVGSGGEKVVFHLEEVELEGQKATKVTGETKKGFVGRAGQKSWTNAILDQTNCILEKPKT